MRIAKWLCLALLSAAPGAWAGSITYDVSVNTTSLSGAAGFLDFQLNPGPNNVAPATAALEGFSTDGILDLSGLVTNGDVSGDLPGTVLFDNGAALNEYSPNITFGSFIDFTVSLSWTQSQPLFDSGSVFLFSMYVYDPGYYVSGNSSPDGRAIDFDINADGTNGASNYSDGSGAPATVTPESTATPEPSGLVLLLAPVVLMMWNRARRSAKA